MLQTHNVRPALQKAMSALSATSMNAPISKGLSVHGKAIAVKPGKTICADGEPADYCYKLVAGFVRTVKLTQDGRRQVCDFLVPGDLIGFEANEEYTFSAEALTHCTVLQFSRSTVESLLRQEPTVAGQVRNALGRALSMIQQRLVLLCKMPAKERVAWLLLNIADRVGGSDADHVDLPMPRSDIADYLGLANETVSRVLGELKQDRVITTVGARRIVFLNRDELEDIRDAIGFAA